jgi:hypothetical protein
MVYVKHREPCASFGVPSLRAPSRDSTEQLRSGREGRGPPAHRRKLECLVPDTTPASVRSGRKSRRALPPGGAVAGREAVTSPEGAGPPEPRPRRAAPRRPGGGRSRAMAASAGAEGRRAALEAAAAAAPERGGGSCVLCCGDLEATALGRCDHPVCYRCSTKMRVLCEQRYCAVCREELRQVRRRAARRGAGLGGREWL